MSVALKMYLHLKADALISIYMFMICIIITNCIFIFSFDGVDNYISANLYYMYIHTYRKHFC